MFLSFCLKYYFFLSFDVVGLGALKMRSSAFIIGIARPKSTVIVTLIALKTSTVTRTGKHVEKE